MAIIVAAAVAAAAAMSEAAGKTVAPAYVADVATPVNTDFGTATLIAQ